MVKNMTKTYGNYNIGPYFIELHMVVYLNGKRHLYIISLVRWNRESRMMEYRTSALSPKSCSHCQSSTSSSPPPSPPGKLTEVRNKQLLCYSASRDLETAVNKDIMTIRWSAFQTFQLNTVSGLRTRTTQTLTWNRCVLSDVRNQLHPNCLGQVRASTPLREMEPTPLDRHRLTHELQL